jgi:ATP-binding cassette subfamily F protein uup
LVSHDRAFLDNVVTSIIAYEGDGFWREYEGGYEDWKIQKKRSDEYRSNQSGSSEPAKSKSAVSESVKVTSNKEALKPQKSAVQKLNGKEREELEVIPLQIDDLEKEQASISERLGDPEIYKNRPADVVSLQENLKIIEGKLSALMSRWEDLLERSNS